MKTAPTYLATSDHMSTLLQHDTSSYYRYYTDTDSGFDPYWDTHFYIQHDLYFYNTLDKQTQDLDPDSPESDNDRNPTIANACVDLRQRKCQFTCQPTAAELENEILRGGQQASMATAVAAPFVNTLVTRTGEPDYVPLTTNLGLKDKRQMLYFTMDFGELSSDGLLDTGALSSAIPEADLRKIRLLVLQSIIKEVPTPNFQIIVANGELETPKSTVEIKFEFGDIEIHEIIIVMEKVTCPLIGLSFLQRNNTILDMRQGVLNFPFFSMQLKMADHKYTNVMDPLCIREDVTIPPDDRNIGPHGLTTV